MNILPNADKAVIPIEKFRDYALNLTHESGVHKAIVFDKVLGYNTKNVQTLISKIREGIANFPATYKGFTIYGDKYEVTMPIEGVNGRVAPVVTGWLIGGDSGIPRLTSAYIPRKG